MLLCFFLREEDWAKRTSLSGHTTLCNLGGSSRGMALLPGTRHFLLSTWSEIALGDIMRGSLTLIHWLPATAPSVVSAGKIHESRAGSRRDAPLPLPPFPGHLPGPLQKKIIPNSRITSS